MTGTGCVVFISHSCRDGELGADLHALNVRNALRRMINRELKATAWIDKDVLEPGDRWHQELDSAMASCDAAVVLLNQNALGSGFLHYETAVLFNRASTDRNFRLISVLLKPLEVKDIRGARAFGVASLGEEPIDRSVAPDLNGWTFAKSHSLASLPVIQLVKEPHDADADAAKRIDVVVNGVRQGLRSLQPTSYPPTDEGRWQASVDGLLRRSRLASHVINHLDDLSQDAHRLPLPAKAELLTRRMFDQGLDAEIVLALSDALRNLPHRDAPYPDTAALVYELRPLWVTHPVAEKIRAASAGPDAARVVTIEVADPQHAKHCIRRAMHDSDKIQIADLPAWPELEPEYAAAETDKYLRSTGFVSHPWAAGAFERIDQMDQIGQKVRGVGQRRIAPRTPPLNDTAGRGDPGPHFVLLPPNMPLDIQREALQAIVERWRNVTAVVLHDPQQPGHDPDRNAPYAKPVDTPEAPAILADELPESMYRINRGLDKILDRKYSEARAN
ncbi:hypothetical protein FAIPA1_310051 [Frankia sp. AiPs1]